MGPVQPHIGTIWSDSFASTEQAFHNSAVVNRLNALYASAEAQGVSAFFATGDTGVYNGDKQGNNYPYPTVTFPRPARTSSLLGNGDPRPPGLARRLQRRGGWNDCCGQGGGGYSTVFAEPAFQSSAGIADPSRARGLPDVSYNAALISSIVILESFDPTAPPSFVLIGGTSAATPQWAAIDAIANQADGALGFLTPRLYQIYANLGAYASAFHDITVGDNSSGGVGGYSAGTGWDAASGLGTPDVSKLLPALAETTGP